MSDSFMPPAEPSIYTIVRAAKYVLSLDQVASLASEFYGRVLEVDPVASGSGSGFDLGGSPSDHTEVMITFEQEAYRDSFLGLLNTPTFQKGTP